MFRGNAVLSNFSSTTRYCPGDVGRPSRWSSGTRDDSWRGGFLLSAIEMYLKNDMKVRTLYPTRFPTDPAFPLTNVSYLIYRASSIFLMTLKSQLG